MVNALTPHLIGNRPNTYTFTKSLAEHVLLQEVENFPIAIFRPSIIGAALKEPYEVSFFFSKCSSHQDMTVIPHESIYICLLYTSPSPRDA